MKPRNKKHSLTVTICLLLIVFVVEVAYLYRSNSEYELEQSSLLGLLQQNNIVHAQLGLKKKSDNKKDQEKQRLEDIFFSSSLLSLRKTNVFKIVKQYKETYGYRIPPIENLKVNISDQGDRVSLVWKKYENAPENIVIYRSLSERSIGDIIAEIEGDKDGYQDIDVQIGQDYFYTVVATSGDYNSAPVKVSTRKIKDLIPPVAPTKVKTVVDYEQGGIKITWENPKDKDFAYVKIYRSETPEFLGTMSANKITETEYLDSSVRTNREYYYTLISVDIHGNETPHDDLSTNVLGNPNPFQPLFNLK